MAICSSCGAQNSDDARFCEACGARLEEIVKATPVSEMPEKDEFVPAPEPEPAPAGPAPIATPALEPKPRRRIKWWAVVLIVLAALLIFLILSVIFKDQLPWGAAIDSFINHLLYSEEELRLLNS